MPSKCAQTASVAKEMPSKCAQTASITKEMSSKCAQTASITKEMSSKCAQTDSVTKEMSSVCGYFRGVTKQLIIDNGQLIMPADENYFPLNRRTKREQRQLAASVEQEGGSPKGNTSEQRKSYTEDTEKTQSFTEKKSCQSLNPDSDNGLAMGRRCFLDCHVAALLAMTGRRQSLNPVNRRTKREQRQLVASGEQEGGSPKGNTAEQRKSYTENTEKTQRTTEKKICVHLFNLCHLCAKNNHTARQQR
jgi:hypothetical protein